jgi:hypothetical protein
VIWDNCGGLCCADASASAFTFLLAFVKCTRDNRFKFKFCFEIFYFKARIVWTKLLETALF